MKTDIHPEYQTVIFLDTSCDHKILSRSTIQSEETMEWEDGNSYPVVRVEISSASHPFYTGKLKFVDTAGRIEKFKKRFAGAGYASLKRGKKAVTDEAAIETPVKAPAEAPAASES